MQAMLRQLFFRADHCPRCGSDNIRRSRRRGSLESLLGRVSSLRPYRCGRCGERFLRPYKEESGATRSGKEAA